VGRGCRPLVGLRHAREREIGRGKGWANFGFELEKEGKEKEKKKNSFLFSIFVPQIQTKFEFNATQL
jgi:hypothetical protein